MDYQLRVISGEPTNGIFPLRQGDNVVGRAADCAVVFESAGVSRQHFMIQLQGDRVHLENKGRFGTQVDDVAVEGSAELFPGSKIRFGMYMLVQFEEAREGAQPEADAAIDPDKTAELPAYYKPNLPEPAQPSFGGDDSFFLKNDDLSMANLAPKRPTPSSQKQPARDTLSDAPESGLIPPPPSAMKAADKRSDNTDPSMMEFDSTFKQSRNQAARPRMSPVSTAAASRLDDDLFSSPEALPARPAASGGGRAPPAPSKPKVSTPAPEFSGENDVHTRGLSPEAIAFMRQEWERKAKGRRNSFLAIILLLVSAGAAAAYFFFFR